MSVQQSRNWWIDTAAVYGLGHTEVIVARAQAGVAQRPFVFTKGSMVWNAQGQVGHSLKADSLRREVEASLRRLQTDAIDLYLIHWPDPDPEIEEGWSTLAALKQEGKLRQIGVSNYDVEQMRRAMAIAPVEVLEPPYSLVKRAVEAEILPFALCSPAQHRRDRVLAHVLRPPDRHDDSPAHRQPA